MRPVSIDLFAYLAFACSAVPSFADPLLGKTVLHLCSPDNPALIPRTNLIEAIPERLRKLGDIDWLNIEILRVHCHPMAQIYCTVGRPENSVCMWPPHFGTTLSLRGRAR